MTLDVDGIEISGSWVRHGRSPRVAIPARDPAPDSRWQRGALVDALYLADKEETAWAEWYRHLAELGVPPAQWLPTYLWTFRVELRVANLSNERRLHRLGLSLPRPGRQGWLSYQVIGEELWAAGWPGLVAPSAARPGGLVLCLFRRGDSVPGATAIPPPRQVSTAPIPPWGMTT
ncbi:MAG: RES family NAD+ phosphorylase [Acidobacteria bacterium]|nr:RES family NAD+ phosphorylase [Acidobacteriota bacterium]